MNIKDRLKSQKKASNSVLLKNEADISEIFIKNEVVEQILSDKAEQHRNFILISDFSCDKSVINSYIKKFLKADKVKIFDNDAKGVIRQYEYILSGQKNSISDVSIQAYDDIIENLKILISVNFQNLTQQNISKIMSTINPVIVHFCKDDDGLFLVDIIADIEYINKEIGLKELYSLYASHKEKIIKENEIEQDEIPVVNEIFNDDNQETNKKINKYKLLREKIHSKKMTNN